MNNKTTDIISILYNTIKISTIATIVLVSFLTVITIIFFILTIFTKPKEDFTNYNKSFQLSMDPIIEVYPLSNTVSIEVLNNVENSIFPGIISIPQDAIDKLEEYSTVVSLDDNEKESLEKIKIRSFLQAEQIETLSLTGEKLDDITGISQYKNLKDLSIAHCGPIKDISEISKITELESLIINGAFDNTEAFSKLSNLKNLLIYINDDSVICDTSSLSNLNNIESLSLAGNLTDISFINNYKYINDLLLEVPNVSILPASDSVESLTLENMSFSDALYSIKQYPNLKWLSISLCKGLTAETLHYINSLPNLEYCSIVLCDDINDYEHVEITLADIKQRIN